MCIYGIKNQIKLNLYKKLISVRYILIIKEEV